MDQVKYAYMCATDWRYELPEGIDYPELFNSLEELKKKRNCWKECGIVRVRIEIDEWLEEPTL